jgi:hypothetical protein
MAYPENLSEQALAPDRSPIWLRHDLGRRFLYLFGLAHDHFAQYTWDGVTQRFPTYAESMSRKMLSRDRRVPLFESEPVPSQKERLRTWLTSHRQAGTDAGVLEQSAPFWLPETPKMRIVAGNSQVAMWTTLNPDGTVEFYRRDVTNGGSNWDWDSTYPFHAEPSSIHRWWLIVYAPPSTVAHPITVAPSETVSVGSSLTSQQAIDIQALAASWRRAGSSIWGWILAFDEASFDPTGGPGAGYPDGTWHRSYKIDGSFNRLSTARYHVERAWTP